MEKYNLTQTGPEVQDILNNATPQSELTAEVERAQEAEGALGEGVQQNAADIDAIEGKIPSEASSENKLTDKEYVDGKVDDEKNRAQGAEGTLQDNIDAEETRAKAAEKQNADDIDAIEEKIPSGASSENKLATENYVNDAVATNTATFRGTYNLVSDLHLTLEATHANVATALAASIGTADNNDFAFVLIPTDVETPTVIGSIDRYKFNGSVWSYEYTLNNSGFTQAQWDAINSGITSGDVTKLAALPTNTELTTLLNGKQDTLTFDSVPTQGSNNPVKSGGVYSAIDDEKGARLNSEAALQQSIDGIDAKIPSSASSSNKLATASDVSDLSAAIEAILLLIPSAASSLNQLADKAFVNSSIATASATFRGTYNLVTDLGLTILATHAQIETALAGEISTADNNDYCFVQIPTSADTPTEIAKTERYKYNGSEWAYEYDLNNSGYTAAQWAAINSGITSALVTKLSALPTNADLTTALGALTDGIDTINEKIPSAASISNKLVDTSALESYVTQVINAIDATFNVTSTDGHVNVQITQVNGVITAVSVNTSDIASADALTVIGGRVTTAEGNITSLAGRVSTNETDIAQLRALYETLTESEPEIIQPTDTWPVANPSTDVIYRVVDRVNTPPEYYSDYMWNGTTMVLMATYDNAIDDEPTPGSNNLVKSGGVASNIVFDISRYHATGSTLATYADLAAALGTNGENVPADIRRGGMSIKFVQTDDNKYVQYRLMADEFTTDTTQWAVAEECIYVENPEFAKVYTDSEGKILWAIKTNGDIHYGIGVPTQVKDYIQSKISELSLDEYEDIVTFLGELIEGDTLATLLNTKVDKVTGKSLIDSDFAAIQNTITNPEYFQVTTDAEGKILEGIKKKGVKVVELPFEVQGVRQETVDNPEYIQVVTDSDGKVIEGTKKNGNKVFIGEIEGLSAKISAAINAVVIPIKNLLSQQLNKVFTKNNNILWLGTSIPRGAQYPTYSAQKCGYVCTNNSYGESRLCWTGERPSVVTVYSGKSLTATVSELEAMFRQDVTAGTITEAQLEEWKDKSYERSVLPYINGTNATQVSMIVLDHGFNDRANIYSMMQDIDSIDWTSKDRSNFVGAFNYLWGKIQEVNPTIKLVIAGYFQNTYIHSNVVENDYHSKEICEMQELIAKHYSISIMKAWEHTQINNEYIAGTDNYISDFNTKYNKSYTKHDPDSNGNIKSMQIYCPDCVHPHSDLTNHCNHRLNAVYAKLLKDVI